MAIPHASAGEIIDIQPLGRALRQNTTTTLIKTDDLEVVRLVLPAGKEIPPHHVKGEITVQCVEGRIAFIAIGQRRELAAGQMLYLHGGDEHALVALEDASVLVTILL